MNGSDPLGIVSAARRAIVAGEGAGQVLLGGLLVAGALLALGAQTGAGRAAIHSSGQLGRTALKLIPQTRAIGALL